jgi:hypothetical protein
VSEKETQSWRERLADLSVKTLASIVGGVITIVLGAVLVAHFAGPGSTSPAAPPTTSSPGHGREFTVEDIRYHGTWVLGAPTAIKLLPRKDRPPNAREWLAEGTPVTIDCASTGATYEVINRKRHEHWHWWARLTNGYWVAMAAFKQTEVDGSQGFVSCSATH